jgi:hypothetical protein
MKIMEIGSTETLLITYKTTWRHNPEDHNQLLKVSWSRNSLLLWNPKVQTTTGRYLGSVT